MIRVRKALGSDIPTLCRLGKLYHAESQYQQLPFSAYKLSVMIATLMRNDECVLVLEKSGQVIGGVLGVVFDHWFSTAKVAMDYCIYVLPEHRRGRSGAMLIKAYVEWAKLQGAEVIQMGISSGIKQDRTLKLYQKLGGRVVGSLVDFGG
ncbi:MAG TPA: GNAT family N-acetyltransferase [Methylovorus sp.]|nr:GNAT family N-acetyltransferase [Methylovorus sp.]